MKKETKQFLIKQKERNPALYGWILSVIAWLASITTRRKIRGKGNRVVCRGAFLRHCILDISGNNNLIEIGSECVLKNVMFFVRGNGHRIRIGSGSRVSKSALLWCEDVGGGLIIGESARIGSVHIAVTEPGSKIEIGNRCLFSEDVEIRCGDSHSIIDAETGKRINPPANVKIENNVWIGAGARVLKGVEIGNNGIVATGAVVTKSVPAGSIAAGNPAKIVRDGVCWEYQRVQDRY